MTVLERAKALAKATQDAHSATRYHNWTEVARKLLRYGLTEREAEAVMRSKWARWAADKSGQAYGNVSAIRLVEFVKEQGRAEVIALTEETFKEQERIKV